MSPAVVATRCACLNFIGDKIASGVLTQSIYGILIDRSPNR